MNSQDQPEGGECHPDFKQRLLDLELTHKDRVPYVLFAITGGALLRIGGGIAAPLISGLAVANLYDGWRNERPYFDSSFKTSCFGVLVGCFGSVSLLRFTKLNKIEALSTPLIRDIITTTVGLLGSRIGTTLARSSSRKDNITRE